jgi:amino acid transporter
MEGKYDDHGFKGGEEVVGRPASVHNEYNLAQGHNQLERGLKSRHIQFLALGLSFLSLYLQCEGCS